MPSLAHAACWFEWSGIPCDAAAGLGDIAIQIVGTILKTIQGLLFSGIQVLGSLLNLVVGLYANNGGEVIGGAWKILRDLCNMAFIVVIIVTSFGTIFNTLGFLAPFTIYNKKLLSGFLMAAIFMNFSLAIGQSIMGLSNHITTIMVGILPKNISSEIKNNLDVQAIAMGNTPKGDVANPTAVTNVKKDATLPRPDMEARNAAWERAIFQGYLNCMQPSVNRLTPSVCLYGIAGGYGGTLKAVGSLPYPAVATSRQSQLQQGSYPPPQVIVNSVGVVYKDQALFNLAPTGRYDWAGVVANAATLGLASSKGSSIPGGATLSSIMATLYSIFLLLVLGFSFLVPIIFSLIRIPILWLILALSPLAWVSLIFPNSDGWREWWKQFMAWNFFSPMYIFVIYIGMYLLAQQDTLLAQLGTSGLFDQQLGILLFYVMTAFIFIGGAAGVAKLAFMGGTTAGGVLGGITGRLGISGPTGAVGAVYRGTGLQTQVQALGERAAQQGRDITAGLRGRAPALFGTREEGLAAARQRFGVRGGEAEIAKLQKDRIAAQQTILKGRNLDDAGLKQLLTSANRDAALAAGEMLLEKNKLTAEELKKMGEQYQKISTAAYQGFIQHRDEQLAKAATEKRYASGEDANRTEMAKFFDLLTTPKQQEAFIKAAGQGKNKIAALELAANRKIMIDGKVRSVEEALEEEAPKLTTDHWLDAESYVNRTGKTMSDVVRKEYRKTLDQPQKFGRILKDSQSPDQQLRVLDEFADVKQAKAQTKQDILSLQRKNRQYEQSIKRLQQAEKRKGIDSDTKLKIRQTINTLQDKKVDFADRMRDLRKTI